MFPEWITDILSGEKPMIDPVFSDWLMEFNATPVRLPFIPAFNELVALMKDRKWQDFRNELIERAKTDSVFLTDARSKAEAIYETLVQLEDVTDELWPADPYTFALTAEMLRFTLEKEWEQLLLELPSDELEKVESYCREHGLSWDELVMSMCSEQIRMNLRERKRCDDLNKRKPLAQEP